MYSANITPNETTIIYG